MLTDSTAPAGPTRARVFLSYTRGDSELAERLHAELEARDFDVYRDTEDIPAASIWRDELKRAIEAADSVVFLISAASLDSEECRHELEHAVAKGKRLFPVAIEECGAKTPPALSERNFIWCRSIDEVETASGELAQAMRTDLEWVRTHTDLGVRAGRWKASGRDDGYLLRGVQMAAAERWLEAAAGVEEPRPTPDQLQLLSASQAAATRRRTRAIVAGAVAVLLAVIAVWQFRESTASAERERDQKSLRHIAESYRVLYQDPLQAVDHAQQSLQILASDEAQRALETAHGVAMTRRENFEDEGQILESGAGYLMQRWRKGDVFSKISRDGRHVLVATERGAEGPDPPGRVFLIGLDSRRTLELHPGTDARGRRLEFMGFSRSGREVLICRQFHLDIFDLEGELLGSRELGYHAKPIHLVGGLFGDYVLVADTLGHVWTADTTAMGGAQLDGGGGTAVFMDSNATGNRWVIVLDSGRADLVTITDPESPSQHRLHDDQALYGTFDLAQDSEQMVTTGRDGTVAVWDVGTGEPQKLRTFVHGAVPVGLASFSADGKRVISLGSDGSVCIWDIASGDEIVRIAAG